jgi:anaerobic magnesium-protoporphyrin IX monomethyl ester cyclase
MNCKKYDILLINPPSILSYDMCEHLGIGYLCSALRTSGMKVKIIDANLEKYSYHQLYKKLSTYEAKIVAFSPISHGFDKFATFVDLYKNKIKNTKILIGGHFSTFAAESIKTRYGHLFDFIIKGEGEHIICDIAKKILNNIPINNGIYGTLCSRINENEINKLSFPSRDYLKYVLDNGGTATISSSRGCYGNCNFCSVRNFYTGKKNNKTWVSRSAKNVVDEIEYLIKNFNTRHFTFIDDNFIGPKKTSYDKVHSFAKELRNRKLEITFDIDCRVNDLTLEIIRELKSVGLKSVFMGIESINDEELKYLNKGISSEQNRKIIDTLKNEGINYTLSMIMFTPQTTTQSLINNIGFLRHINYYPRNPISILNIYHGTNFFDSETEYNPLNWEKKIVFKNQKITNIYEICMEIFKKTLKKERELINIKDLKKQYKARNQLYKSRLDCLYDLVKANDNDN